jgi:hypothetical protein
MNITGSLSRIEKAVSGKRRLFDIEALSDTELEAKIEEYEDKQFPDEKSIDAWARELKAKRRREAHTRNNRSATKRV